MNSKDFFEAAVLATIATAALTLGVVSVMVCIASL